MASRAAFSASTPTFSGGSPGTPISRCRNSIRLCDSRALAIAPDCLMVAREMSGMSICSKHQKRQHLKVLPFIHDVIYFNVVVQVTLVPQSHWPLLIAQHLLYGEEVILVQAKSPDWFHLEAQSSADLLGSILVKMMFL